MYFPIKKLTLTSLNLTPIFIQFYTNYTNAKFLDFISISTWGTFPPGGGGGDSRDLQEGSKLRSVFNKTISVFSLSYFIHVPIANFLPTIITETCPHFSK